MSPKARCGGLKIRLIKSGDFSCSIGRSSLIYYNYAEIGHYYKGRIGVAVIVGVGDEVHLGKP
ncbi:hypothetical protein JOD02_002216 [Caldicoprobacter guelmensis]|uniref:hypothetical protein n=1 Tax=Caldicoprobacter guelmensis TaxID=1170224 RepID=UPI001959E3FC|nr:hypothetical protein [Caldicoprobacter guelmensis]MBM7583335.1 hypothetical protein [Caldicoprobacter guelmensis]